MAKLLGCEGQGWRCCEGCLRRQVDSQHKLAFVTYKPSEYDCVFHISPSFLEVCKAYEWEPKINGNSVEV